MGRDPDYLQFLRRRLATAGPAPARPGRLSPRQRVAWARREHAAALAAVPRPPVAQVRDVVIDGPGGRLPARLYRPGGADPVPGLVYFHGGGWMLGDVESYDPVARALVVASGVAVVSVDYRRPPEDPFPAAVDDAVAAVGWTVRNARRLGLDAARLGVAGDSAGGQIAAAAALRLRGTGMAAAVQVLVYPALDLRAVPPAPPDPDGLVFPPTDLRWVVETYLDGADPAHPEVSPLLAPEVSGLPPAVVATAEYDRLRPQGLAYAARLRAAGVPVTLIPGAGLDHGYLGWGSFARRPAAAVARIGAAVGAVLGVSPGAGRGSGGGGRR
ncbi:alpha/beta hydrolase fold domain-containing protein [Actinomadura kijaniata]|uniref:alpha/beta hydrolase fold domain-containing protein n=1 Tax=Actinomadura kijaniata TaxID=46161 RepID=UPI0008356034|nr:alpha/beta hydrolase fold domain-containing protein [Actinomadura kijaniata]